MTRPSRTWTLEAAHHLDVWAVPLDVLREAVAFLEGEAERRELRDRDLERDLARLERALWRRERRLLWPV